VVILTRMESFYRDAYHQPLPKVPDTTTTNGNASQEPGGPVPPTSEAQGINNSDLGARLSRLMEAALQVAERALAVEGRGDVSERCRRLEQASWDRLYPANGTASPPASALERGLASRLAEQTA
jgi:hypothetical protein